MINIIKTPNADSRAAGMNISISDLSSATEYHICHVQQGLLFLEELLMEAAEKHDHTKLSTMEEFHKTITTCTPGIEVKQSPWYKMHITEERHHLLAKTPSDVNLIDVLEYITDCVMAGMSRTGKVLELKVPDDILRSAFNNTVSLLKANVNVVETEEDASDEE